MSLLRRFSQRIDRISDSHAPVDTDGARPQSGLFEKEVMELYESVTSPAFTLTDLPALLDAVKNLGGVGLNDRKMLLEKLIIVMSKRKDTEFSKKMQQIVINLLYKDLPHPPSGYLCLPQAPTAQANNVANNSRVKYAFRSADGSNNNPLFPTLGQAGSPYARSVPSTNISPKSALPDPGLVFDTLLKRDKFTEHPGGISALFFAFADLVIHSIFNTNHTDWTINDSSSYLDLSVLYGNSESQVDSVRRKDGSGKLWDDVFADSRLLHMPPASCALLVLLNRNHNFVAERIFNINEGKNFKDPAILTDDEKITQDDEIFHRSRLVNCGYFMNIILGDYVGAILGLVRDQSDWRLDPLMTIRELSHNFAPVGEGNVVSVEFNLLYRWHATLSEQDTAWTESVFNEIFEGNDLSKITIRDFKEAAHKHLIPPKDVKAWTFNKLKRNGDGRFKDEDLAKILHDSTSRRAGAFKAKGIPEVLRVIEIMGIQQSRTWGTCSLNEFRKFLGLKPYSTFKEWNPDPEIHKAAAALYKDIDNLELHVGLQAEEAKKPVPGAGLCPGYTISRAILADAVCLTRGDRFMTVDFTPFNLTAWGYQDCQYDTLDGSYGGLLTKLLFRTLPDYYPRGSAYAHFPFLVPEYMESHLKTVNPALVQKYTWNRPRPLSSTVPVDSFADVKKVLADSSSFLSAYDGRLFTTVKPILAKKLNRDTLRSEEKMRTALDKASVKLTTGTSEVSKHIFLKPEADVGSYYAKKTQALVKCHTFSKVGTQVRFVDVVKDVINILPIHWISQEIAGLPLKTEANPSGLWYEQITYEKFAEISEYVYLNFEPVHDWHLRESAQNNTGEILEVIKAHIDKIDSWISISDSQNHLAMGEFNSHAFLKKLWQSSGKGSSTYREFASQIFAAVVPTAPLYSQAVATVVNFYLDADKQAAREEIVKLVASKEKDAADKVMGYVYEALRLDPPVAGVYRTAAKDDNLGGVDVKAGQNIFASIYDANRDESVFGKESKVANVANHATHGIVNFGEHGLLTSEFFKSTVPHVLSTIFSLKGLQRGPGQSGSFTRFTEEWHGGQRTHYITQRGHLTPFPDSLVIQYNN